MRGTHVARVAGRWTGAPHLAPGPPRRARPSTAAVGRDAAVGSSRRVRDRRGGARAWRAGGSRECRGSRGAGRRAGDAPRVPAPVRATARPRAPEPVPHRTRGGPHGRPPRRRGDRAPERAHDIRVSFSRADPVAPTLIRVEIGDPVAMPGHGAVPAPVAAEASLSPRVDSTAPAAGDGQYDGPFGSRTSRQ